MFLSYLDDEKYKEIWDKFIVSEGGWHWQSWQWGQAAKLNGSEVFYLAVFEKDESGRDFFCAACIAETKKLPFGKCVLTVCRGPVMNFMFAELYPAIELIFNELEKIAKEKGAIFLRIDPPVLASQVSYLGAYFSTLGKKITGSAKRLSGASSSNISLAQSNEEIISAAPTKFSYNLKIAEQRFEIEESNLGKDAQIFLAQLKEKEKIGKYWREFFGLLNQSPIVISGNLPGESSGQGADFSAFPLTILLAKEKEEPAAAIIFIYFGWRAELLYEKNNLKNDLMALYLLHWRAINDAKSSGAKEYDTSRKLSGIADDLGGKLDFFSDSYDIVYDRFWYKLLKKADI